MIISYTFHHFTPFTGKYELTIDLAPSVWLHSSVGRASHRYRYIAEDFFRLLYSNCLNWKFTAKITYHLHIYPQFLYESFHIHFIITKSMKSEGNSALLPANVDRLHLRCLYVFVGYITNHPSASGNIENKRI